MSGFLRFYKGIGCSLRYEQPCGSAYWNEGKIAKVTVGNTDLDTSLGIVLRCHGFPGETV